MTTLLAPPHTSSFAGRGSQNQATQAARRPAPSCSLRARPLPQPAPVPSWEELLGQR